MYKCVCLCGHTYEAIIIRHHLWFFALSKVSMELFKLIVAMLAVSIVFSPCLPSPVPKL